VLVDTQGVCYVVAARRDALAREERLFLHRLTDAAFGGGRPEPLILTGAGRKKIKFGF